MLVRCQCGWEKTVKDELLGKMAKCPKCGTTFELQPAAEVAAAFAPPAVPIMPVMTVPAEPEPADADDGEWLPPGMNGETEGDDPFAEIPVQLPHMGPPKLSPWKTPTLNAFCGKLKGHFPSVALSAWILHIYSRICWIVFAVLVVVAVGVLGLGLFGAIMGMASRDPNGTGALAGVLGLGVSFVWSLSVLGVAISVAVTAAFTAAVAELSAAWAASFVSQQISPCGGMKRAE